MKPIRLFLFCLLTLTLIPLYPVMAQNCSNVTIQNDSTQQLDTNRICTAAARWTQKGLQVYIWVTDKPAGSASQDWLSLRDHRETAWGIYDRSNDTFRSTALAIELTTDTSKSWGQDFAFGEKLFGTALDSDQAVNDLENSLKNRVAAGNITTGIVESLNSAYDKAFSQPSSSGQTTDSTSSFPDTGIFILLIVGAVLFVLFKEKLGLSSGTDSGSYQSSGSRSFHRSGSSSSHRSSMGSSRRR